MYISLPYQLSVVSGNLKLPRTAIVPYAIHPTIGASWPAKTWWKSLRKSHCPYIKIPPKWSQISANMYQKKCFWRVFKCF